MAGFWGLLLGFQALLIGAGAGLLWATRRESLFFALHPQLPWSMILAVGGAAAMLSPLGEELFFRGALQPLVGLLGAALVFGLVHTGFRRENLAYGWTAAGAGALFGLSYQFLGELWAPVVAHAVYNFLALALLLRLP